MVQLRDKQASDDEIVRAGRELCALCHEHGALFLVNDRPDLAVACDADGVHVGQDDMPVDDARAIVGPNRIVGTSTHSPEQVDAGDASDADYYAVGPVFETPTKEGRPATGWDLIGYAAGRATKPWFAIGGMDPETARAAAAAGAERVVVVRAIRDADDPAAAAAALDPIRARLLAELAEPGSAASLAPRMGITRQKVNYHLRALESHGLVHLTEERKRGGITERVLQATAASYVVSPAALGATGADPAKTAGMVMAAELGVLTLRQYVGGDFLTSGTYSSSDTEFCVSGYCTGSRCGGRPRRRASAGP
jgi:thiamine-phosphate pyrophosphorylase